MLWAINKYIYILHIYEIINHNYLNNPPKDDSYELVVSPNSLPKIIFLII